NRITDIRTVFWVAYENTSISAQLIPILGDDNFYDFYRGANKNLWDQSFTNPNILNGNTKVNGINVNGLTTTIPTEFSIISLSTTGNVQANNFSQDRLTPGRAWHGGFAELLIYNTPLSAIQISQVENYLADKYAPPVNLGPDIQLSYGFCDTSISVGTKFKSIFWSTGDTTEAINVSKTGKYWVNVIDIFGRNSTDTVYVNFPVVKIPNDNIICLGDSEFWLTELNPAEYTFNWNDGSSDSKILLDTLSDFHVSISDTTGCVYFSDTLNFMTNFFPSKPMLGSDTFFCGPNFLKILPTIDSISNISWSTGNNSDSIYITQSGIYELDVTNEFNCKRKDTINIFVNIPPQFSLGNDTGICYPNKVVLNPGLNNCNILWQDNSNNPTFNVNSNGFFWAKATDSLGCSFTDTISISIDTTLKHASLGPDTSLCSGSFIYLNGITSNNGINFLWSDNSTNSNLQVSGGGIYWIKAVNNNGCSLKDSIDITISGIAPLVSFAANNNCFGTPNNFINFSTAANGDSILGYSWNFGDGTSDTTYSPNHTFQDTGYFFVNLDIKTINGCQASKSDTIHVFPNPSANFSTSNSFCSNTPVIFTDSSQTYGYPISALTWNFGDPGSPNNNSNSIIASHLFSSSGPYQISMIVIDVNGCSDSLAKNLTILPSPIADFNFGPACETEKTQFFDTSNLQGLQALNYYWNFSGTEGDST
ncbi:MAG: PKD domain-containing protein, partial [Bacteroidota bacterium]